jgi:tetratricopeptide (TPR) repeat protein
VREIVVKTLILLVLVAVSSAMAEDPRVTTLVKQGDAEERAGRTRVALGCFRAAEEIEPKNVGVLLRISKQYSDLIDSTKPRETAEQIALKSLNYAQRAVEIDPKVAKAHLSLAVAYGKMTDFVGNKEKLEYSKLIKEETLKSIELDATDDFAWHVLGRWHSGVANVSGVLKLMAKLVYGGMPPASNEDAVKCLKKAVELAPQRITHRGELARAYEVMGKKDLADKEWKVVLTMPATDKEDEIDHAAARLALNLPKPTATPARQALTVSKATPPAAQGHAPIGGGAIKP